MTRHGRWRIGALVSVATLIGVSLFTTLRSRPDTATTTSVRPDTGPADADEARPSPMQRYENFWQSSTAVEGVELAVTSGSEGARLEWHCYPRVRSTDRLEDYRVRWFLAPPDGVEFVGSASRDVYIRYGFDTDEGGTSLQPWSLGSSGLAAMPERAGRPFARRVLNARAVALEAIDPWDRRLRRYVFGVSGFERTLKDLPCGRRYLDAIGRP